MWDNYKQKHPFLHATPDFCAAVTAVGLAVGK